MTINEMMKNVNIECESSTKEYSIKGGIKFRVSGLKAKTNYTNRCNSCDGEFASQNTVVIDEMSVGLSSNGNLKGLVRAGLDFGKFWKDHTSAQMQFGNKEDRASSFSNIIASVEINGMHVYSAGDRVLEERTWFDTNTGKHVTEIVRSQKHNEDIELGELEVTGALDEVMDGFISLFANLTEEDQEENKTSNHNHKQPEKTACRE